MDTGAQDDYDVIKKSLALYIFLVLIFSIVNFLMYVGSLANIGEDTLFAIAIGVVAVMFTAMIVYLIRTFLAPKNGFLEFYIYNDKIILKYPKTGREITFQKSDIDSVDLNADYGGVSMGFQLASGVGVSTIGIVKDGQTQTFETHWSSKMPGPIEAILKERGYNHVSSVGNVHGVVTTQIDNNTGSEITTGRGLYSSEKPKNAWLYMILAPLLLLSPTIVRYIDLESDVNSAISYTASILAITGLLMTVRLMYSFIKSMWQKIVIACLVVIVLLGGPYIVSSIYLNQKCIRYERPTSRTLNQTYCLDKETGRIITLDL